uniref:Peroxiredoxin 6 n=1 Tax=Hucho hucho TaxID=62062 RepID=A0A4W5NYP4_9TELE
MPGILLGDVFPNFELLSSRWGVRFSHPQDFTPVCTTKLACAAKISDEFKKRIVKMITPTILPGVRFVSTCLSDVMVFNSESGELSVQLGMLDPDEIDKDGMPLTTRCEVFVVGPDKKMKLSILYPATTGRNFDELLTALKKVATPVGWKPGQKCMVIPSLSGAEAAELFPNGIATKELPSGKRYLRYTQP